MIQPINSLSFKALYEKPYNYNEQQNKTIFDIRAKLGNQATKNDYIIEPSSKKDSVLLYKFQNLKCDENGQKISFDRKMYIGTYGPENKLSTKDLISLESLKDPELKNKIATITMILLGTVLLIASAFLPKKTIGETAKTKTEQVIKSTVDTLQNLKKDTINYIK